MGKGKVTSIQTKKIKGTHRKTRDKKANAETVKELPSPDYLTGDALTEWERLAPILENVISHLEVLTFESYCVNYGRWRKAVRKVNSIEDGETVLSPNGIEIQSPWVGIMNKAMAQMRSDYVKLKAFIVVNPLKSEKNNNDPWDQF